MTPWPQILQWDGWVSPAHSSSALSATLATVFISGCSHIDNWWPSLFVCLTLFPSLSLCIPLQVFLFHFSFFSLPSALLALLVCLTVGMFVGVHTHFFLILLPLPPSVAQISFLHLPPSFAALPSHLPRLHIPLHLSISLPCTIGTKVAPSEWAIKRPYKKPQHREERVMMKFNCSSWYTWGLAQCVWICGYMRADVCTVHVFVCVQKAWGLGTEPELPC